MTEGFKGLRACTAAWREWFEAAGDYRLTLREIAGLEGGQVFAVLEGALVGKSTGIHVNAPIFVIVTLRDGLILRIDEYLERREALKAVDSDQ